MGARRSFPSAGRSVLKETLNPRGDQASVTMRLCTGLSRAEFALLARPRTTSRATDRLYLFDGRLLGLHDC